MTTRLPRWFALLLLVLPFVPVVAVAPDDKDIERLVKQLGQITPSTCAQTATIAMNKAIEASAPASSTTARTIMLPHFSRNEKGT